jgi:trans-aconitate 2-methyltransferase
LPSGATMAWQVPGNFLAPSHRLLYELVASSRWRSRFPGLAGLTSPVGTAADYAELLLTAGWSADAWETTYVHLLQGDDAVLNWVRGTTLGPVRRALTADEFADFEREYGALLRSAYPPGRFGTSYPFRRIFAVGRKP